MADEISLTLTVAVAKASVGLNLTRNVAKRVTMTGDNWNYAVQTIGTTEEALGIGDVATAGYVLARNSDATNYVEIGRTDGGTFRPVIKLKAGEVTLFRAGLNAMEAKANTAAVKLEAWIISD